MSKAIKIFAQGVLVLLATTCSITVVAEDSDETSSERSGQVIYETACIKCHGPNQSIGIPKDDPVWDRLVKAKGLERLILSVKKGTPGMPANGLCNGCTTNEFREAIQYMRPPLEPEMNFDR